MTKEFWDAVGLTALGERNGEYWVDHYIVNWMSKYHSFARVLHGKWVDGWRQGLEERDLG